MDFGLPIVEPLKTVILQYILETKNIYGNIKFMFKIE